MSDYGLFINYEYCTGCHACEVACKKVHKLSEGEYGIRTLQDGPRQNSNGKWDYTFLPLPTSLCDLCEERVKEGRLPSCVHHCQAEILFYDSVENLAKEVVKNPRSAIFVPR